MAVKNTWAFVAFCVALSPGHAWAQPILMEEGSFFVGGERVEALVNGASEGRPIPAGTMSIGQMYVHFRIPAAKNGRPPVILAHASRHTGAEYETTPDGREGWTTIFARNGFSTYVVDAPGIGRSGFNAEFINREHKKGAEGSLPVFGVPVREFDWFGLRIGTQYPVPFPGSQFPVEAADSFFKQVVPNVLRTLPPDAWEKALTALIERIGPAILVTHSLSGVAGWKMAANVQGRLKAVVSIEPPGCTAFGALAENFKTIPVMVLYGDNTEGTNMAKSIADCRGFTKQIADLKGRATVALLPDHNIKGNTHMVMLDKNSHLVAAFVQDWIMKNTEIAR